MRFTTTRRGYATLIATLVPLLVVYASYMGKYGILASSALMFNVASFSSLLFTIYATCNTSSFNWMYLLGNVVAQLLLISYGVLNRSPEIYVPTLFLFVGLLYIVYKKATCSEDVRR